jgi:hypothetical protein
MRVRYLIPAAIGFLVFSVVMVLWVERRASGADKKTVTIKTPSGEITWKEDVSNKAHLDDTIAELTKDELAALERDSKRATDFVAAFVSPEQRTGDILEDLDKAFAGWLNSGKRDTFTANDVIRVVGSALGFYSIQKLGVRWARVTDAQGTDIALVAERPPTRSFPFTSVQYRIEDKKTDFVVALFRSLEHAMKTSKK